MTAQHETPNEQALIPGEDGPWFSTVDRRRITRVPPGLTPTSDLPVFIRFALICAVATALGLWGAIECVRVAGSQQQPAGLWWLALAIPGFCIAFGLGFLAPSFGHERYGRGSVAGRLCFAGISAGAAVVLAIKLLLGSSEDSLDNSGIERTLVDPYLGLFFVYAAVLALACVGCCLWAGFTLQRAKRERARTHLLRETGAPHPGEILALPDPRKWQGWGQIPIRYGDSTATHELTVNMEAAVNRVPLPGTRLRVFLGSSANRSPEPNEIHVELDPTVTPEFDTDTSRYRGPSGGGS